MTWIDIVPRRGARPAATPPVTVAWHVRNTKPATEGSGGEANPSAPKMNIAISALIAAAGEQT